MSMAMKILILFMLMASPVIAADKYMATNGVDSGACPIGSPCATLDYIDGLMSAGETLYIRGGAYNTGQKVTWSTSGSSGNVITIKAYTGETPVFSGGAGLVLFTLTDEEFITIDGLEITGYGRFVGAYSSSNDITIKNNYIHDNTKSVVNINDTTGGSWENYNWIIENNIFVDNGDTVDDTPNPHDVYLGAGVKDGIIRDNIFICTDDRYKSSFIKYNRGGGGEQAKNGQIYNNSKAPPSSKCI